MLAGVVLLHNDASWPVVVGHLPHDHSYVLVTTLSPKTLSSLSTNNKLTLLKHQLLIQRIHDEMEVIYIPLIHEWDDPYSFQLRQVLLVLVMH